MTLNFFRLCVSGGRSRALLPWRRPFRGHAAHHRTRSGREQLSELPDEKGSRPACARTWGADSGGEVGSQFLSRCEGASQFAVRPSFFGTCALGMRPGAGGSPGRLDTEARRGLAAGLSGLAARNGTGDWHLGAVARSNRAAEGHRRARSQSTNTAHHCRALPQNGNPRRHSKAALLDNTVNPVRREAGAGKTQRDNSPSAENSNRGPASTAKSDRSHLGDHGQRSL